MDYSKVFKDLGVEAKQLVEAVVGYYLADGRKIYFFPQRRLAQLVRSVLQKKRRPLGLASQLKVMDISVVYDERYQSYMTKLRGRKHPHLEFTNLPDRSFSKKNYEFGFKNPAHGPIAQLVSAINVCLSLQILKDDTNKRLLCTVIDRNCCIDAPQYYKNIIDPITIKKVSDRELKRKFTLEKRKENSRLKRRRKHFNQKRKQEFDDGYSEKTKKEKIDPFASYRGGKSTLLSAWDTPGTREIFKDSMSSIQAAVESQKDNKFVELLRANSNSPPLKTVYLEHYNEDGDHVEVLVTKKLSSGVLFPVDGTNFEEYENTMERYPKRNDVIMMRGQDGKLVMNPYDSDNLEQQTEFNQIYENGRWVHDHELW